MLKLILEHPDKYPLDGVVHFELEIDYPFIKNVIDYMESECMKHGIKFVRLKPRKSWQELYERYGFPTRIGRWCNSDYKLDAAKQIDKYLNSTGMYRIAYIGYCADETKRYEKRKHNNEIYPLVDFEIEEDTVLEWAKNVSLFNDYYKFNRRCGCMLCPMLSFSASAYLLKYYPNQYELLMQLAKNTEIDLENRYDRHFSVFSGNPKYDSDYRDKRVREKYLPELEKMIKENGGN